MVIILDSVTKLTTSGKTLELREGESYTLRCEQTGYGHEGEYFFKDPVFFVQSPGDESQKSITQDDKKYFLATGQSTWSREGSDPIRYYYLGVSYISSEDNGTKYTCISNRDLKEQDVINARFKGHSTTLKVKPG